jgi:hypothetical protein
MELLTLLNKKLAETLMLADKVLDKKITREGWTIREVEGLYYLENGAGRVLTPAAGIDRELCSQLLVELEHGLRSVAIK